MAPTYTPLLSLPLPALDDLADVSVLETAFTILDAAVTRTGAQTLTNKTLTAPVINGVITTTGLTLPTFTASGPITATDLVLAGAVTNTKVDAATVAAFSVDKIAYTFSAATLTGTQYGNDTTLTYSGGTALADMRAGAFVSLVTGLGTVAQMMGVYGRTSLTGGANVVVAFAHYGVIQNASAGGVITTGYAFYAYTPNVVGGGSVGTSVGFMAENQGAANVTNAYGVRIAAQSGAASINIGLKNEGTSQFDGVATFRGATGLTAGGDIALRLTSAPTTSPAVLVGSGVPSLSAPKGSLYLRSDGTSTSTRAYINTDGGGTWTAITTAA